MSVKKEMKVLGEDRRKLLLDWLLKSEKPITGSELAARTKVSRQVIVQDISLLKARGNHVLATSQGYMMIPEQQKDAIRKTLACFHRPEAEVTRNELYTIVDKGAVVVDVSIEHQIYGELTALLMLSSRRDVDRFIKNVRDTNASLLSELTDGTHLHTIEAPSQHIIDETEAALKEKGYLLT
ncbi:transcription repressor NadR [Alteribacillus sp. HJP-4]|uniref:transcription repressor NadR n=1 Tax=Alteribacillus sp. HJP-4 TaxID=2775394 RepID=UPI0035CCF024